MPHWCVQVRVTKYGAVSPPSQTGVCGAQGDSQVQKSHRGQGAVCPRCLLKLRRTDAEVRLQRPGRPVQDWDQPLREADGGRRAGQRKTRSPRKPTGMQTTELPLQFKAKQLVTPRARAPGWAGVRGPRQTELFVGSRDPNTALCHFAGMEAESAVQFVSRKGDRRGTDVCREKPCPS